MDTKCAPSKDYTHGSCFTTNSLVKMVESFNQNHPKEKIPVKSDKKYLVSQLNDRLKDKCSDQLCWLQQTFVTKLHDPDIKDNTFRPKGPQGKFEWLSTVDINKVMEQYHHSHPEFKFLGAVPIDFDDLPVLGIKKLDFAKLKKEGKTKLGIVFNLDEHYKSGSHWVAAYVDLNKPEVYYFDSYGKKPERRIRKLLTRAVKWCYKDKYGKEFSVKKTRAKLKMKGGSAYREKLAQRLNFFQYNKKRHQYKDSECGVYSINFILRLMQGEKFQKINGSRLPDDDVNKCRGTYFHNFKGGSSSKAKLNKRK